MGRKYAIRNQESLHFVTFTAVYWLDVFIRDNYRDVFYESAAYCQKNKGLCVHAYCIMSSHIHLILSVKEGYILSDVLRDLKSFTSRQIRKVLEADHGESRRDWMLWMMKRAGLKNERNKDFQLWQQHNHPIELSTNEMVDTRLDYIHDNPVKAGLVEEAYYWKHSSAAEYSGLGKSRIELILI